VNPELPVVERVGALSRGGLPRGDLQRLRLERLRAYALDPGLLCDPFDFLGKLLQLAKIGAGQLDPGVLRHYSSGAAS
jgi:hypothetical protein